MEIGIALRYTLSSTMASAGLNDDDGLPTAWFLGQTFHGLAIQIPDRINLLYCFSTVCTGSLLNCLAYAAWTQYSLRPPTGGLKPRNPSF